MAAFGKASAKVFSLAEALHRRFMQRLPVIQH